MNIIGILKLIMLLVSLCNTLAQNDDPKLYKVIGEDDSVSNGWSLLSSDHPLFSDSEFLTHIHSGDCEHCRVIVWTGEISVEVKGNSSVWAGEDLKLSCVIEDEEVGLLFPPVTAEIRTHRNTDGEFLNDTVNIGTPFMDYKHSSFSVTSKCHLNSASTGESFDLPSHPLTTTVKCKYYTYIQLFLGC